jgi:hypothetical protein
LARCLITIRRALRKGIGINRTAKLVGLSNGTVQRIKDEMMPDPFGVAATAEEVFVDVSKGADNVPIVSFEALVQ